MDDDADSSDGEDQELLDSLEFSSTEVGEADAPVDVDMEDIAMEFDITMVQRLDAALHDVTHMTDIYLPVIAVSFLIAMPVATLIIKYVPNLRLIGYVLAGAVGLVAIHVIMKMLLGFSGIAPTRTIVGLLAQAIAGGVGGYLFHLLSLKRTTAD